MGRGRGAFTRRFPQRRRSPIVRPRRDWRCRAHSGCVRCRAASKNQHAPPPQHAHTRAVCSFPSLNLSLLVLGEGRGVIRKGGRRLRFTHAARPTLAPPSRPTPCPHPHPATPAIGRPPPPRLPCSGRAWTTRRGWCYSRAGGRCATPRCPSSGRAAQARAAPRAITAPWTQGRDVGRH